MAYSAGDTILDDEYNNFVNASSTPFGINFIGGTKEITLCQNENSTRVFGVVSEAPAFLMNRDAGNNDSHPMIALKGRVRVKVTGTAHAGDRLVCAEIGRAHV